MSILSDFSHMVKS